MLLGIKRGNNREEGFTACFQSSARFSVKVNRQPIITDPFNQEFYLYEYWWLIFPLVRATRGRIFKMYPLTFTASGLVVFAERLRGRHRLVERLARSIRCPVC